MSILTHVATAASTAGDTISSEIMSAGFLPSWLDPANIVSWLNGYHLVVIGVLIIIFAETGLLVGFFLPGDSILFTVGMFFAGTATTTDGQPIDFGIPFWLMLLLIFLAAFLGDQVGYLIGKGAGPRVFDKPDSKIFKREYVDKTYDYFERYGGRTVILARFIPIVRTFAPVAAGVGKMHYRTFVLYNFIGALLWGVGVTCLGYLLGQFTWVGDNIDYIFIFIVLISVVPIFLELWKGSRNSKKAAAAETNEQAS